MDMRASNLPIGDPNGPLEKESVSRSTYVKLPLTTREDLKDKLINLRASHFNLGDNKFQGLPEYKAAYVKQGLVLNPMNEACAKDIRDSHISYLFNRKQPDWGRPTYQDKISDQFKVPMPAIEHPYINIHKSNLLLGEEKPMFNTEMRANYINHGILDKPSLNFSRRENNLLGEPKEKVDYTTETKERYTGPAPDLRALGLAKEFSKGLRRENFSLGRGEDAMTTHYKVHFTDQVKKGKPAKLNVYQLNDVKRNHFDFATEGKIGITHYTDQHRWLQPIPKIPEELKH